MTKNELLSVWGDIFDCEGKNFWAQNRRLFRVYNLSSEDGQMIHRNYRIFFSKIFSQWESKQLYGTSKKKFYIRHLKKLAWIGSLIGSFFWFKQNSKKQTNFVLEPKRKRLRNRFDRFNNEEVMGKKLKFFFSSRTQT